MAVLVVDGLEAVEVHVAQRGHAAGAVAQGQRLGHTVGQQQAVGQAGQAVVEGDVLHLLLVLLHGRHVLHQPQVFAIGIQRHAIHVDPDFFAIELAHAALLAVVLARGQDGIGVAAKGQEVLAAHIHLFGGVTLQLAGGVAKDALQRRVAPQDDAVLDLGNADQVVVQHGLLLLVEGVQRLPRRVQLRHVVHDGTAHHKFARRIADGGGRDADPARCCAFAQQGQLQGADFSGRLQDGEVLREQRLAFGIQKIGHPQLAHHLLAASAQPGQALLVDVHVFAVAVERVVAAGGVVVQVLEAL